MLQNDCFSFHGCFSFHFWKWIFQVMDSYFSLLNLSFVENCNISTFTTFAKQSMINRWSNAINRNRSAAKISKVMSSTIYPHFSFLAWLNWSKLVNNGDIHNFVQNRQMMTPFVQNSFFLVVCRTYVARLLDARVRADARQRSVR